MTSTDVPKGEPPAAVQRRFYELMVIMKAADDRLSKGIASGEFLCVYWPTAGSGGNRRLAQDQVLDLLVDIE